MRDGWFPRFFKVQNFKVRVLHIHTHILTILLIEIQESGFRMISHLISGPDSRKCAPF